MAGGRSGRPIGRIRALLPSKLLLSTVAALLLLALLTVLLTSAASGGSSPAPALALRRTFLALNSSPIRTRLDLIYHQASDHLALVHAYAAYARRLKLSSSHQLHVFETLTASLSDTAAHLATPIPDEDALRPLEKEAKDRIKLARQIISESKESFDTQLKIQKLRDTIFAAREQLSRARKLGTVSSRIAAGSTPKSLHCLAMRLMEDHIAHPELYPNAALDLTPDDSDLYHFAIFSDNVIAVSVVINSAIRNADEPWRHVFHVVTDSMYHAAMRVWFTRRPLAGGARVEIKSVKDFTFLNSTYSPVVQQIVEKGRRDMALLDYLRFYLPDMYPGLRRIVYLEDDVVVQRDLAGLWRLQLDGKVNGAVEMCFGGFKRYNRFMNFSHPVVRERFNPRACAWAYGVNVFDLDAWRREGSTEKFHEYQMLAGPSFLVTNKPPPRLTSTMSLYTNRHGRRALTDGLCWCHLSSEKYYEGKHSLILSPIVGLRRTGQLVDLARYHCTCRSSANRSAGGSRQILMYYLVLYQTSKSVNGSLNAFSSVH